MSQPNNIPHEHTIRLRRPWQKRLATATGQLADPIRIEVPEPDTGLACQPAVYLRKFNRPSSLGTSCRVRLNIGVWSGQLTSLRINDQALDVDKAPIQVDITSMLQDHNCIEIDLAPIDGENPRLTGPVNLVIVSTPTPPPV